MMDKTLQMPDTTTQDTGARALGFGWGNDRPCLADLLRLLGASSEAVNAGVDMPIPVRRLHTGDALFHEGAPAEAIYFVRAGTFKTFCTAEDGYEQVLGFAGRTEVLGFDAVCMDRHPTAAVALEESSVFVVLVRDMFAMGRHIPGFDRVVALSVSRALTHRGELADVMAATSGWRTRRSAARSTRCPRWGWCG
jgi:CRP/FNR family transcriptional regulator